MLPASRISTVSQNIQSCAYPNPNSGALGVLANNWTANYPGNTGFTHYDHFDIRGDYNATSRDLIDARFSWRLLPLTVPALPGSGPARTEHCAGIESYDIALRV